jgi:hypothetical protein
VAVLNCGEENMVLCGIHLTWLTGEHSAWYTVDLGDIGTLVLVEGVIELAPLWECQSAMA